MLVGAVVVGEGVGFVAVTGAFVVVLPTATGSGVHAVATNPQRTAIAPSRPRTLMCMDIDGGTAVLDQSG